MQDGRSIKVRYGGERDTTSNRMEPGGVIRGLLWLPPGASATVVSDSKLVVEILSGNWRAKSNLDLVEEAWTLMQERRVEFRWTRSHAGGRWNKRADNRSVKLPDGLARRRGAGRPLEAGDSATSASGGFRVHSAARAQAAHDPQPHTVQPKKP